MGHRAAVIMPAFRSIRRSGLAIETTDISFAVPMDEHKLVGGRIWKSSLPDADVPVWLIDQPQYFDRDSLYGTSAGDYPDNAERFAFFCRAALVAIARMGWQVDIVHCNDWQSGLVPGLIKANRKEHPWMQRVATVMTIHNLAYQGQFPREAFRWTGLDWKHFNPDEFEFYDHLNFLKAGIISADMVTTVSPSYAEEIRTPEQGCGLDAVLRGRSDRLVGIINGIDPGVWSPVADSKLAMNYSRDSWQQGKRANKRALQETFALTSSAAVPMIGLVGRFAEQKGWDLVLEVLRRHLRENRPTQWVVLGSGDPGIEHELRVLAVDHGDRFGLHIGFSDDLAHRIEAGADLFVMPSRYEPCGLNQLYSLGYGTVPIVTPTGGLSDTVVDCTAQSLGDGTATGFHVHHYNPESLDEAIGRALHLQYHDPESWKKVVETGMSQDWSWRKSAVQYIDLYEQTIALSREKAY